MKTDISSIRSILKKSLLAVCLVIVAVMAFSACQAVITPPPNKLEVINERISFVEGEYDLSRIKLRLISGVDGTVIEEFPVEEDMLHQDDLIKFYIPLVHTITITAHGLTVLATMEITQKPVTGKFYVTFNANGGIIENGAETEIREVVIGPDGQARLLELPTPVLPNFYFSGWFSDRFGGDKVVAPFNVTEDITLFARYTNEQSFTVRFYNFYRAVQSTQVVILGQPATAPVLENVIGQRFDETQGYGGWKAYKPGDIVDEKNPAYAGFRNFDEVYSDLNVYPCYVPVILYVRFFEAGSGTQSVDPIATVSVPYGSVLSYDDIPPLPNTVPGYTGPNTPAGYDGEWQDRFTLKRPNYENITKDMNVVAVYTKKKFEVTFYIMGKNGYSLSYIKEYGGDLTAREIPTLNPDPGYTVKWMRVVEENGSDVYSEATPFYTNIRFNLTFKTFSTPLTYTLRFMYLQTVIPNFEFAGLSFGTVFKPYDSVIQTGNPLFSVPTLSDINYPVVVGARYDVKYVIDQNNPVNTDFTGAGYTVRTDVTFHMVVTQLNFTVRFFITPFDVDGDALIGYNGINIPETEIGSTGVFGKKISVSTDEGVASGRPATNPTLPATISSVYLIVDIDWTAITFDRDIALRLKMKDFTVTFMSMNTSYETVRVGNVYSFKYNTPIYTSMPEINLDIESVQYAVPGFKFDGWFERADFVSGKLDLTYARPYILKANVTFYACWLNLETGTEGLEFTPYSVVTEVDDGERVTEVTVWYARLTGFSPDIVNGTIKGGNGITIPKTDPKTKYVVTTIAKNAFGGSAGYLIETISIPNSITVIEEGAFSGCASLKAFNVSAGSTFGTIDGILYDDGMSGPFVSLPTLLISAPASGVLSSVAFTAPNTVLRIANGAFSLHKTLATVVLTSVIAVGDYAFSGAINLTSVTMMYVTTIGARAFEMCEMLSAVVVGDPLNFVGAMALDDTAWYKREARASDFVVLGKIGIDDLAHGILLAYVGNAEVVTLADNVKRIGAGAFRNNTVITKLIVTDTSELEFIEQSAFYNCINLGVLEINLSPAVVGASDGAFASIRANATVLVTTNELSLAYSELSVYNKYFKNFGLIV